MALALGVGLLAGCGPGDPEPTGSGSLTAGSPTPTAVETTPTELVTAVPLPVMPPEMANNDAAGAEAAVRYSLQLYGYTYLSQDLGPWNAIADDDCVFCNSVVENVEEMKANGKSQYGGILSPIAVSISASSEDLDAYVFEVTVAQSPYEVRDSGGRVIDSGGESTSDGTFAVAYRQNAWILIAAGNPPAEG